MKSFFATTFRMAVISILISLVLTVINIPILLARGKEVDFWRRFLAGAAVIFAVFFLITVVKTIIELIRYAKDPGYKDMNQRVGISWKDYQKLNKNGDSIESHDE